MDIEVPQALMLASCGEPVPSDANIKRKFFLTTPKSPSSSSTLPFSSVKNHSQSNDFIPSFCPSSTAEINNTNSTTASVSGPFLSYLSDTVTDNNNNYIYNSQQWYRRVFLRGTMSRKQLL